MKAVIQRVKNSRVSVDDQLVGEIGKGILVFLGVEKDDTRTHADYLASKIVNLRIFEDSDGKMNLSLRDVKGNVLVISQFTLMGDCRKGRRPSFTDAAEPEKAEELYQYFISQIRKNNIIVSTGKFQAKMDVYILNDGPVTFLLDSKNRF
ncbi:MAG: D-aminoacyl-tRNA deacylase [Pseudomonadota bacterium]